MELWAELWDEMIDMEKGEDGKEMSHGIGQQKIGWPYLHQTKWSERILCR